MFYRIATGYIPAFGCPELVEGSDAADIRMALILDVPTLEEAQRLTEADPAVKAGCLIMEIHPWQKGDCLY